MKQLSQAFAVISQHRLLKALDEKSQEELAGIANLRDYAAPKFCTTKARM
jgi:hypothetical protein